MWESFCKKSLTEKLLLLVLCVVVAAAVFNGIIAPALKAGTQPVVNVLSK